MRNRSTECVLGAVAAAACWLAVPTSPAAPEDPPAVVWAVGDGADGSKPAKRLARLIEGDRPARFLYLGDVYESGTEAEFEHNYDAVYGDMAGITSPTPGNHEWANRRKGYYPYWRAATGRRQRPWYGLKVGEWEILSLNSEASHGPRSRQLRWLRRRLRDAKGDCRIAFWHRPRLSAGVYGDDPSFEPFWRALEGKARLVLSGHDHNMQRFGPRDGLVQLVAGTGGIKRYPLHADKRLRFGRDDARLGAIRLELTAGVASIEFRGAGGRVLDRSSVSCSAP